MRIIRIKLGKFAGEHQIFDDDADFLKYHPDFDLSQIRTWSVHPFNEYKVGDWVRYMDGCIGQLLDIYIYKWQTPRYRFRFANYVSAAWWRIKTSDWGYYNIYGRVMHLHESTNLVRIRRKPTRKNIPTTVAKARFVAYILAGIDPLTAYKMIFRRTVTRITNKHVRTLLMDEEVRQEIQEQTASLQTLARAKFSKETLIEHLVSLVENSRKGSMNHRENLRFVMEITGDIEPPKKKQADPKEIPATWSSEAPPPSSRPSAALAIPPPEVRTRTA